MSEVRVYTTDKDIFIVNGNNRIFQSKFISSESNCESSDCNLHFFDSSQNRLNHSSLIYSPGIAVLPVYIPHYSLERAQLSGADTSDWTHYPSNPIWLPEYEKEYPIIKVVRHCTLEEYRRVVADFPALKDVEKRRVEEEIKKVRDGRNKNLDTLADFFQSTLNAGPRLRSV
ncbi:MAG TPA: hypothetical protein VJA23_00555 [Candidatus Nanoarchaeia archaeon]|nr:hypothetical protein [Candidatus Nanoarchaeia archaeon]